MLAAATVLPVVAVLSSDAVLSTGVGLPAAAMRSAAGPAAGPAAVARSSPAQPDSAQSNSAQSTGTPAVGAFPAFGAIPATGAFPAFGATGAVLADVSCTAPGSCVAVGNVATGRWVTHALAETWSGGHWQMFRMPNPAGAASSYLFGVSCRTASDCVAVGASIAKSGGWRALAESWNGTSWRLVPPAFPAGAQSSDLFDVSCGLASACMAVGSYADRHGKIQPLTQSLSGGIWKPLAVPVPAGRARASLNGLSCSGSACLAVGSAQAGGGQVTLFTQAWVNGAWQPVPLPGPDGMITAVGQDVSCTAGTCVIVGYANRRSTTAPLPLAGSLASGTWRVAVSLAPPSALLSGVSCPVRNWCGAVGGSTRGREPIAETWNGAAWQLRRPPVPAGARSTFLSQVSCFSPTSCLAVGGSYGPAGRRPMAESWNGTSWQLLPQPPA